MQPSQTIAGRHSDWANLPIITDVTENERQRMLAQKSFEFRHSLTDSGSFTLENVRDLIGELLKQKKFDNIYCRIGKKYIPGANVSEALDALESTSSDTWIRLTQTDEVIPQFKKIADKFKKDLSRLYNFDVEAATIKTFATLFVSSPKEITPYHIDHTWNFLLQLSGRKTVHLFDPSDNNVLRQTDLEKFYAGVSDLKQKEGIEGIAYDLVPGEGVHHPVNAPHWVQNGSEVSISLSLGHCLHSSTRDAKIYQANYLLRKFGISPVALGMSARRDNAKERFLEFFSDRHPTSFNSVVHSGFQRITWPARRLDKLRRVAVRLINDKIVR